MHLLTHGTSEHHWLCLTPSADAMQARCKKSEGHVVNVALDRTLVYSVKCPICMQMEMGPRISLCLIPLWMESMKFGQRSNPCWLHKWP